MICLLQHSSTVVSSGLFYLWQIKSIRRCLPADVAKSLVNAFMVSRLDYCNIHYASLPRAQLVRIQSVFNEAVQLTFGAPQFSHVTPLLHDCLHCCPLPSLKCFMEWCLATFQISVYRRSSMKGNQRSDLRRRQHRALDLLWQDNYIAPDSATGFLCRGTYCLEPSPWKH